MERKTLNKARVKILIDMTRQFWETGDKDILETMRKMMPEDTGKWREEMAVWDIASAVIGTLKEDATNEQIFNIFQILGYDIV